MLLQPDNSFTINSYPLVAIIVFAAVPSCNPQREIFLNLWVHCWWRKWNDIWKEFKEHITRWTDVNNYNHVMTLL